MTHLHIIKTSIKSLRHLKPQGVHLFEIKIQTVKPHCEMQSSRNTQETLNHGDISFQTILASKQSRTSDYLFLHTLGIEESH